MIKQKDITILNVSDYIREQKKLSKTAIYWDKKALKIFRKFAKAVYAPDEYGIGWKFPKLFPNGITFMGIKHF